MDGWMISFAGSQVKLEMGVISLMLLLSLFMKDSGKERMQQGERMLHLFRVPDLRSWRCWRSVATA